MYEGKFPTKRYKHTLRFLKNVISKEEKILDLGVPNPFSEILTKEGFQVTNTKGEDLDLQTSVVKTEEFDVVTAFEIFEHLVSPFNFGLLRLTKVKQMSGTATIMSLRIGSLTGFWKKQVGVS